MLLTGAQQTATCCGCSARILTTSWHIFSFWRLSPGLFLQRYLICSAHFLFLSLFLAGFTRRAFSGDCGVLAVSRPPSNPFISTPNLSKQYQVQQMCLSQCQLVGKRCQTRQVFGCRGIGSCGRLVENRLPLSAYQGAVVGWPMPSAGWVPSSGDENDLSSLSCSSGDLWDVNRRSALKNFLLAEFIRAF